MSVSKDNLLELSAFEARAGIDAEEFSVEDLTRACLDRINDREKKVGAWAYLKDELALKQAQKLDLNKQSSKPTGSLFGLPVGIKDIIDTKDMPTECGSEFYKDHLPIEDSTVVRLLRKAGAVILGKTVTTEMALSAHGKTTNPLDITRTPGGSSSGSAAAVGDKMVPLAIGSQTGGSVIRPASFCGIFGYKPTFGSISRRGMSLLARRLDHVGVFARTVDDLALIADALMVYDSEDWDMVKKPGQGLVKELSGKVRNDPTMGFVRGPAWDYADPDMATAFENFVGNLGSKIKEIEFEGLFSNIVDCHITIMDANLASYLGERVRDFPDKFRAETIRRVNNGRDITASDYIKALNLAEAQAYAMDSLFDHYDVLLTPAAPGEAPTGLESTGNAIFNGMWTLIGVPAVTVPLLKGKKGLPIGLQVIGRRGNDTTTLKAAKWLWERFGEK
ncbi:MAG: amidase [Pseudomonadota bacterium]|nr:amidase [Pseudomonadota bacterium]